MRTTVELTDEQRAELLRLAARRRLKGFSGLIQEAVDAYLTQVTGTDRTIQTALTLEGSLTGKAGAQFQERVRSIRRNWR